MAETMLATEDELDLMAAIEAGRVVDNDACLPLLDVNGQQIPFADPVWALYRRGWIHQLENERVWRLTWRGRDVMQGRTNG